MWSLILLYISTTAWNVFFINVVLIKNKILLYMTPWRNWPLCRNLTVRIFKFLSCSPGLKATIFERAHHFCLSLCTELGWGPRDNDSHEEGPSEQCAGLIIWGAGLMRMIALDIINTVKWNWIVFSSAKWNHTADLRKLGEVLRSDGNLLQTFVSEILKFSHYSTIPRPAKKGMTFHMNLSISI